MTTPMDPTTLVTFLFKAPPAARTVELLGSWDNFCQPYRMYNDVKRGSGFWSGCFRFHNIIFDGDKAVWTKPRTGGLKQGGTYWYYYRLDDEIEAYDDSKEYTTGCPLLPGQTVNVIEVPMEVEERPNRSRSASFDVIGTLASLSSTHTLDPRDKFAALAPPPISKVHDRCKSDLALNGRLENNVDPATDSSARTSRQAHSEHTQNRSAIARSPGRFYMNSSYVDDRSSNYSRRSRRSTSSRSANSSVVNTYGVESSWIDDARSVSPSSPDVPRLGSKSRDEMPPREMDRIDSHSQTSAGAFGVANKFQRFAFGLPSSDVTYRTPHAPLGYYDLSDSSAPVSPRDMRVHNSRPATSHGADEASVIRETNSGIPAPSHSSPEPRLEILHGSLSRCQSDDRVSEVENDPFDICSPTFSAATVSSTGGLNTPYRLSVVHSSTGYQNPTSDSIEGVAERLRLWGSINDDSGLPPPILEEVDEPPSLLTGYALPSEAMQSTQSLGKLSSGQASTIGAFPSIMMTQREESSFADSIFTELSYLDTSIA